MGLASIAGPASDDSNSRATGKVPVSNYVCISSQGALLVARCQCSSGNGCWMVIRGNYDRGPVMVPFPLSLSPSSPSQTSQVSSVSASNPLFVSEEALGPHAKGTTICTCYHLSPVSLGGEKENPTSHLSYSV